MAMGFGKYPFLIKMVWFILLGLMLISDNTHVKFTATASDCFMEYFQDTHIYQNMFNKDIANYEVKYKCETDDIKNDKEHPDNTPVTVQNGTQSREQCHLIAKRQDTGICGLDEEYGFYEYPALTRLDPGTVGHVREVNLRPGVVHKIITKSVTPPIFEIPSFLSSKECDYIISMANKTGMDISGLVGVDINTHMSNKSRADIDRISQTSWLWKNQLGTSAWLKLRKRIARLTQLPLGGIARSEAIQVVHYQPGGHYHAHLDSTNTHYGLPCCFQKDCVHIQHTPQWHECCRICRYITFMVYLNDVEEGGETAFPLADLDDNTVKEMMANGNWSNLSRHCHNASLLVKPEKGKAVLWYNHEIGDKGYLGLAVNQSFHGGCDVIKGSKWIANFWISWPSYEHRFAKSSFHGEAL